MALFRINSQRPGIALVIAILIMAVMSLVGVTALNYSRLDIKISHHTRVNREAFYLADASIEMSPKIIRSTVENNMTPAIAGVNLNGNLYNRVMGFPITSAYTRTLYPTLSNPDLQSSLAGNTFAANVDRTGKMFMAGGGVEFGAGAEGIGAGAAGGGIIIKYYINSVGFAPTSARSNVDAGYRYVPGVPGGK